MSGLFLVLLATSLSGGVPNHFVKSTPALADQVNGNFDYLDSLVKTKLDGTYTNIFEYRLGSKLDTSRFFKTLSDSLKKKADLNNVFVPSSNNVLQDRLTISGASPTLTVGSTILTPGHLDFMGGGTNRIELGSDGNHLLITQGGVGRIDSVWIDRTLINGTPAGFWQLSQIFPVTNLLIDMKPSLIYVYPPMTVDQDLTVNGKINTPTTPAQVPDYVFEPSYHLMQLSDLESFTRANKHLPEVPSADEMSRDGMDLKAMNLVLLKKVEELTLHVIELSKQVQSLEAQKTEKGRKAP